MTYWWDQLRKNRPRRAMGYDPRQVDTFLAHIGAGYAAGIEAHRLATAIRKATFPLVSRGYDTDRVDEQLEALAEQLIHTESSDAAVISAFMAA